MSDTIIEVAAKVIYNNGYDEERSERHYATARAVIAAVTPLIRATALEEAAAVAEGYGERWSYNKALIEVEYIARAIRDLKEQP